MFRFALGAAVSLVTLIASSLPVAAQDAPVGPALADGLFVKVADPLTSLVTNQVKRTIERGRQQADKPIRTVVLDFNPGANHSSQADFGPCFDLAAFLLTLHDVTTVAFVHRDVTGHTVLPVLACKEIVMASDARLGNAVRDDVPAPALDANQLAFYRQVAQANGGGGRVALVRKMVEAGVQLAEGQKDGSRWFLDGRERDAAEKAGVVNIRVVNANSVRENGLALYSAADAQRFGLCKLIRDTQREVADAYGLTHASLRGDPLQGRAPFVWQIKLNGPVNAGMDETLRRRLSRAVAQKANVIILQLDCSGGSTLVAGRIAENIRKLSDDTGENPLLTIAYIPREAPDTATYLALACSEIVMKAGATLGNMDGLAGAHNTNPRAIQDYLTKLAEEQHYPTRLPQLFLDRGATLLQVHEGRNPAAKLIVTEAEFEELQAARGWVNDGQLKAKGQTVALTAGQCRNLGIALEVADEQALYASYGFDRDKVRLVEHDWLDRLAEFLRRTDVSFLLVVVGIGCLLLEMKLPGFGLPGVIAATSFILFFWAHSQFSGQIIWLAALLFLTGLLLLAVELFVLPGFGVTGVSGILFLLGGLGLATLERVPQTSTEWTILGNTITLFGGGMLASVFFAFAMFRVLPYVPIVNRVFLRPSYTTDEVEEDSNPLGIHPETAKLLGQIGTAATILRPAGMARFGEQLVDVVTDGDYVQAGASVQVIEIEGHRIVVKEVS